MQRIKLTHFHRSLLSNGNRQNKSWYFRRVQELLSRFQRAELAGAETSVGSGGCSFGQVTSEWRGIR